MGIRIDLDPCLQPRIELQKAIDKVKEVENDLAQAEESNKFGLVVAWQRLRLGVANFSRQYALEKFLDCEYRHSSHLR